MVGFGVRVIDVVLRWGAVCVLVVGDGNGLAVGNLEWNQGASEQRDSGNADTMLNVERFCPRHGSRWMN